MGTAACRLFKIVVYVFNEGGLHARSLGTAFGARLESTRTNKKPSTLLFFIETALPCTIKVSLVVPEPGYETHYGGRLGYFQTIDNDYNVSP